jgi:hypothetical protein
MFETRLNELNTTLGEQQRSLDVNVHRFEERVTGAREVINHLSTS